MFNCNQHFERGRGQRVCELLLLISGKLRVSLVKMKRSRRKRNREEEGKCFLVVKRYLIIIGGEREERATSMKKEIEKLLEKCQIEIKVVIIKCYLLILFVICQIKRKMFFVLLRFESIITRKKHYGNARTIEAIAELAIKTTKF